MMNNETIRTLLTRRSMRSYKPEQIKDEELFAVIECGKYAASAMGEQSPFFIVVQNQAAHDRIAALNARVRGGSGDPFYGAPTVILVLADAAAGNGVKDGSCAIQNMMDAAHALGLGSCWIDGVKEMFDDAEGKALLREWGVEKPLTGIGSCILGYAAAENPEPKPRKDDYVEYIK